MSSSTHPVIADTQLKGTRRPEMALACLKPVLSFSQPSTASTQNNSSLATATKHDKPMTKCHICGRAMPGWSRDGVIEHAAVLPICHRAKCRPEHDIHTRQMNRVHKHFWGILRRFERKA